MLDGPATGPPLRALWDLAESSWCIWARSTGHRQGSPLPGGAGAGAPRDDPRRGRRRPDRDDARPAPQRNVVYEVTADGVWSRIHASARTAISWVSERTAGSSGGRVGGTGAAGYPRKRRPGRGTSSRRAWPRWRARASRRGRDGAAPARRGGGRGCVTSRMTTARARSARPTGAARHARARESTALLARVCRAGANVFQRIPFADARACSRPHTLALRPSSSRSLSSTAS